jgi:hypothetical protein
VESITLEARVPKSIAVNGEMQIDFDVEKKWCSKRCGRP